MKVRIVIGLDANSLCDQEYFTKIYVFDACYSTIGSKVVVKVGN